MSWDPDDASARLSSTAPPNSQYERLRRRAFQVREVDARVRLERIIKKIRKEARIFSLVR